MTQRTRTWSVTFRDANNRVAFRWRGDAAGKAAAEDLARAAADMAWRAALDGAHAKRVKLPAALFATVRSAPAKLPKDEREIALTWTIGAGFEAALREAPERVGKRPRADYEKDLDRLSDYLRGDRDGRAAFWNVRADFVGVDGVAFKLKTYSLLGVSYSRTETESPAAEAALCAGVARWALWEFHVGQDHLIGGRTEALPDSATLRAAALAKIIRERPKRTLRIRRWLARIGAEPAALALLGGDPPPCAPSP